MAYKFPEENDVPGQLVDVPSSPEEWQEISARTICEMDPVKKKQYEYLHKMLLKGQEKSRNPFHTFVLLIGETGAGKSSTLNHLMGLNMIGTSSTRSETRSSTAYTGKLDVDALGMKGLKLSVVDTPGFNDTSGFAQDACNLRAIQNFCAKHISSSSAMAHPNLIILCVRATDNRFDGDKSCFTKGLQILEAMRIIDSKNVNLILVMTMVCQLSRNPNKWKEEASARKKDFKKVILEKLNLDVQVIYIENCPSDNELERIGNSSLLPDGTKQPDNLLHGILQQLKENGDEIGYNTLQQVCTEDSLKNFYPSASVEAKMAVPDGSNLDTDENECLLILQDVSGASQAIKNLKAEYERMYQENKANNELRQQQDDKIKSLLSKVEQSEKKLNDQIKTHMSEKLDMEKYQRNMQKSFEDKMKEAEIRQQDEIRQLRKFHEEASKDNKILQQQIESMKAAQQDAHQREISMLMQQLRESSMVLQMQKHNYQEHQEDIKEKLDEMKQKNSQAHATIVDLKNVITTMLTPEEDDSSCGIL